MKNADFCLFETKVHFCAPVPKSISDEISSPINAQIFDFCDPELFAETLQNSEFNSCSNCCYDKNSPYATNLSNSPDQTDNNGNGNGNGNTVAGAASFIPTNDASAATNITTNSASNLTAIFDSQEELDNDISASIDFSPSASFSIPQYLTIQSGQFDVSQVQSQMPLVDPMIEGLVQCPMAPVGALIDEDLPSIYVDDCLSSLTSYMPLNPASPSCSFVGTTMATYLPTTSMNPATSTVESCGMFSLLGPDLQDLDYQGDNCGLYSQDCMQGTFNPADLQVLNNENLQLAAGAMNCTSLASDLSSLKDSTFKVGKLSTEERKEKIHRYMKKRNERNFSKKIKYACRKTLADSRPRVRGRFAKNDELAENHRAACSNHEGEEEEEVVVKEEDSMVDSSDIFAHISGVNSFKCNYPIQSWT
ncbi:uncharacterized protein LOC101214336 isoform X2 [Cucumis sativus]|uniref:Zinc finger-like protein n=1 Tax=Cucumis sativus TaxID=3659 RepID=B0F827_CUCSA|nr:uncharacterized protein LOC101214336 isoform X2 [Cucumis sativus]ABY56106.1 zinc finger-like protein [Cucumis sativus]KAE8651799.1 hypothetical protein Csa_006024 [Cucumis sativus]